MAKNIIQDVVAKNRRSIRQISISRTRRSPRNEARKIDANELEEKRGETARSESRENIKKRNVPKIIIWTIALLSLIFLLFSATSFFSTATVIIVPKIARVTLNDSYLVRKDALPSELQFEVMTLRKKASKQLEATETENSKIKASGKIIVYNNFSAAPQRLIINTRFESGKGLIYKIPESIVVPGFKSVGGNRIPGSVETKVFADEPGNKYNMKVSDLKGDFKIPGFKGDKRYDYFYARLKTDIAGGTSGLIKKVPAKILDDARSELRANIKSELIKEAYATKPQSSVLFADASYIDYLSLPDSSPSADKVEISESAAFYGIIFDEDKLSSYVAKKNLPDYDGAPVNLTMDDNAAVSISNNSKVNPWESDILSLSLRGGANIVWTYDESLLRKSLAGQGTDRDNLKRILSFHSGIKEISAKVRPIWKHSFPSNPAKINIENLTLKN
ncbi:MAG: hypothetical protein AAB781_01570 [Patescibacteria group bacterium]